MPEPTSLSHGPASANLDGGEPPTVVVISASAMEAVKRGVLGRCPRCGGRKLFLRFLKPIARCDMCGQDWTHQQADDFPAYVSILLTGHILAPLIIALVKDAGLSVGVLMAIIVPLALVMMIGVARRLRSPVGVNYDGR